jgi:hypothetical protein
MLTEALLTKIERDLHVGPQFVSIFQPFFVQENPMFLLAVIRYRRNPTWDSALSIYHMHISEKSKFMANISSPSRNEIETYVKTRGDSQKAFASKGVNLHFGAAKPNLFDGAFRDVMTSFSGQVASNPTQKAVYEAFLEKYELKPRTPVS